MYFKRAKFFCIKKLSGVNAVSNGALFVGDASGLCTLWQASMESKLERYCLYCRCLWESEKLGLDLFQCPSISLLDKKRKIETEALINSIGFFKLNLRSDTSLAKGLRRNIMKLADNYKPLKLFIK
ncbi:MAG: hypothetical protein CM15mP109_03640 [Candidatus Dadabacteria bacterium]|nr:MAG: hypothetical protein CM15mP109_03640 [Candidatus Dadabacteria bacterium]